MDYSPLIQQHFNQPQQVGALEAAAGVIKLEAGAIEIGYYLVLWLKLDNSNAIMDAHFQAYGCPVAIALGSWLTTFFRGKTLAEALSLREADLVQQLEIPPNKRHLAAMVISSMLKLK